MKYTTLLIDLDDTLFDFKKSEETAIDRLMESYGIPVTQENRELYSAINDSKWKLLEKGKITRAKLSTERFADFFEKVEVNADPTKADMAYKSFLAKTHFPFEGAIEACAELSKNYSLFIITNGASRVQKGRLSNSPIMKYVKDVFISEDIGFNKPSKGYFDYVLEHIEEKDKSKILVVGDSLSSDIAGAKNSGLDACWVNRNSSDISGDLALEIKSVTELVEIL